MEKSLPPGLRALLAFLGVVAIAASVAVGTVQVRLLNAGDGSALSALALVVCVLAAWGGVRMLIGVYRGRIEVRRPSGR